LGVAGAAPARTTSLASPPQISKDQPGQQIKPGVEEGRVHPALETAARVAGQVQRRPVAAMRSG
jgi:hypothetical protein